ncbi:S24 family peptidase [Shinella pollutisoli]|uniref:S24 family peptidase n=1 Tax=Shinella pollutisoli TaxID=2250594 RepID=A0ABV7DB62_9HYPH|nr:S24 family peptidase [Shinella pollutisoli]
MTNREEQIEREKRAARLAAARIHSKIGGIRKVSKHFGWNENKYKSHESGRNGFGIADAKRYAKAFKVNLKWLQFGIGQPDDADAEPVSIVDVPRISWVSAGQLTDQDGVSDFSEFPTEPAIDLPEGDWICLEVQGNSMNKISPPESLIFVNLRDKRLVSNACYVVCDETGAATYKRYRPSENPSFQPASYEDVPPPRFQGAVTVVGRVRRSLINM